MRLIGGWRGQHKFGVRGNVDLSRTPPAVGQGDAPRLGIKVANLSYQGTSYVEWPEQRAMDTASYIADLAVAVMGGNDRHYAHAALNVLAVGSVTNDTRRVSSFSAGGPLETDPARFIPDLAANGEGIVMPQSNWETTDRIASGTSYSSPQVAGAMALYRSIRTTATSLETRAAVLASVETIGDRNASAGRNAYGLGYLRTDLLVGVALDPATVSRTLVVPRTQASLRVQVPVIGGRWYSAVLAWNRQNALNMSWCNLDLAVSNAGVPLGLANTPRNVHERVLFRADVNGTVDVDIRNVSFEPGETAVVCGLVVAATLPPYFEGTRATFGTNCGVAITNPVAPVLGATYNVIVSSALTNRAGILLYSASNRLWGNVSLPLDLAAYGAVGCALRVSPDYARSFVFASGVLALPTPVPNDPALLNSHVFHQAALATTTNSLGAVFSGGLDLGIGGFGR